MANRMTFPGFSVLTPQNWRNLTEFSNDENHPFTIADPENGFGALQFSPAIYREGPIPSPSIDDLASMVLEFAQSRGLGSPLSTGNFSHGVSGAAAEFHADDDLVVVWYVTDGRNIMLVTYICDWESRSNERDEREAIVRSIRF